MFLAKSVGGAAGMNTQKEHYDTNINATRYIKEEI